MQRYNLAGFGHGFGGLVECPNGKVVLHTDAQAAVAEARSLMDEAVAALGGRLVAADTRGMDDPLNVVHAIEEYVAAEDALPQGDFDTEDYTLSGAVASLVRSLAQARREALGGLSYGDLCMLSRAFNEQHDLRTEQERRVNEALKRCIASALAEGGGDE